MFRVARIAMPCAVTTCALVFAGCGSETPTLPKVADVSSAAADSGITLKATAPTLVAPAEAQVIIGRPRLEISPATGLIPNVSFSYQFEISSDGGGVVDTTTVDNTVLDYSGSLVNSSTYTWRARAARDGQFFGPWSGTRTFKTGALPGCINGVLADPRAFFYYKNDRQIGTNANDWVQVMLGVGWPAGYAPGVRPPQGPPYYGFSQQIGNAGPRGRVFLPTNTPDPLGFFSRETDFLANGCGGLCWAWAEKSEAPAYAPQACP